MFATSTEPHGWCLFYFLNCRNCFGLLHVTKIHLCTSEERAHPALCQPLPHVAAAFTHSIYSTDCSYRQHYGCSAVANSRFQNIHFVVFGSAASPLRLGFQSEIEKPSDSRPLEPMARTAWAEKLLWCLSQLLSWIFILCLPEAL